MQIVDNRGLACPEPVIRTKKALDAMTSGTLVSIVDNEVAKENVLRLANSKGLKTSVKQEDSLFHIEIVKEGDATTSSPASPQVGDSTWPAGKYTTLLIKSDLFGVGDPALGQVLMKSFFHALNESSVLPREIFLVNSGVKLACKDSPVLAKLQELKEKGVQIFSCGTCLDFYQLNEQLGVGEITNMFAIVEALTQADKAITL